MCLCVESHGAVATPGVVVVVVVVMVLTAVHRVASSSCQRHGDTRRYDGTATASVMSRHGAAGVTPARGHSCRVNVWYAGMVQPALRSRCVR